MGKSLPFHQKSPRNLFPFLHSHRLPKESVLPVLPHSVTSQPKSLGLVGLAQIGQLLHTKHNGKTTPKLLTSPQLTPKGHVCLV